MHLLIAAIAFGGPWIQDANFPQAKQEAALNATLRLKNPETNGEGTAVRIGSEGPWVYYLTANHNLNGAKGSVDLESFASATFPKASAIPGADIKRQWPEIDLALIRARETDPAGILAVPKDYRPAAFPFAALTVGSSTSKALELIGDRVENTLKGKNNGGLKARLWETEKPPVEGRSGGPIIDANGILIGICSGKNNGKGYYVHLEEIVKALTGEGHGSLLAVPPKPEK